MPAKKKTTVRKTVKKSAPKKVSSHHHSTFLPAKLLILLGAVLVGLLGVQILSDNMEYRKKVADQQSVEQSIEPTGIMATFYCDGEKTVDADFQDQQVTVKFSDGEQYTLPQTMSADGGRYANEDESIIFWNKGNTAMITGTKTPYTNCATKN